MSAPVEVLEPSLFDSLDPPRLAGSRCRDCAVTVFPAAGSCPSCAGTSVELIALPTDGTIWSWTVQRLAPKAPYQPPPGGFRPFAVGYVDLGEVLVESLLAVDLETVHIGMPVRLALSSAGDRPATFTFEQAS